jgi:hypothetical protein
MQRGILGNVLQARLHVVGDAHQLAVLVHVAERADVERKDDLGRAGGGGCSEGAVYRTVTLLHPARTLVTKRTMLLLKGSTYFVVAKQW